MPENSVNISTKYDLRNNKPGLASSKRISQFLNSLRRRTCEISHELPVRARKQEYEDHIDEQEQEVSAIASAGFTTIV